MSISDVSEKVRYLLWAKSAGRCQYDGCNKPLWRDGLTQIEMNFGEVAHIIPRSDDWTRADSDFPKKYVNDVSNLMLLCRDHHKMVDNGDLYEMWSAGDLRAMKQDHEFRIEQATSLLPNKKSHIIFYRGNVGNHSPGIDIRDARNAMSHSWYPVTPWATEIGMTNSNFQDHEDEFWEIELENLERQFACKVKPLIEATTENHFSVFAFAPQPLLIKLGTLLSDVYPAEVYQLHREPPTWKWQEGPDEFDFQVREPDSFPHDVALILSFSSTIEDTRIEQVLGDIPYSIWKMYLEAPNNDCIQDRWQLKLFRREFRLLLDQIKARHGENAVIHLFPSVPISVAVEVGRVWQPKADLPIEIYDQNRKRGGFTKVVSIGQ